MARFRNAGYSHILGEWKNIAASSDKLESWENDSGELEGLLCSVMRGIMPFGPSQCHRPNRPSAEGVAGKVTIAVSSEASCIRRSRS